MVALINQQIHSSLGYTLDDSTSSSSARSNDEICMTVYSPTFNCKFSKFQIPAQAISVIPYTIGPDFSTPPERLLAHLHPDLRSQI
jgi:hypothetical protein